MPTGPTQQRYAGDGYAGEGSGYAGNDCRPRRWFLFEGVEPGLGFGFPFKSEAPLFEELDVGLTVVGVLGTNRRGDRPESFGRVGRRRGP